MRRGGVHSRVLKLSKKFPNMCPSPSNIIDIINRACEDGGIISEGAQVNMFKCPYFLY